MGKEKLCNWPSALYNYWGRISHHTLKVKSLERYRSLFNCIFGLEGEVLGASNQGISFLGASIGGAVESG
jgi:hypothetical protein